MLEHLKARKAEIARLRKERGATDPILIIAGIAITLILLVGGSFAISGFIGNAHNLNAKADLDRVATAQAAYMAENDGNYATLVFGPNLGTPTTAQKALMNSSIAFTPTEGTTLLVRGFANGWTAVSHSGNGEVFIRTSESSEILHENDRLRAVLPSGRSASQLLTDINNVKS
jgi:hypothetical protein